MNFLDKLLDVLKNLHIAGIDLSSLKSVENIHLLNNVSLLKFQVVNKTLNINIPVLNPQEKKQLLPIIRDAVLQDGEIILEEKASSLLQDFRKVDQQSSSKKILDFFKGKIYQTDLEILRAGFYINDVYLRRQTVSQLKIDVVQKYGERGRNIVNLYTAGYFMSVIKPLYEEMSIMPDFSSERFLLRYDVIVTQYPFAVFVNRNMSLEKLKIEVQEKISYNKRYGIRHINLHGIGEENVTKIETLLFELKEKKIIKWPPQIDSGKNFIIAKIEF